MKWTGHSDFKSMKPYIASSTKSDAMAKIAASWEEEEYPYKDLENLLINP